MDLMSTPGTQIIPFKEDLIEKRAFRAASSNVTLFSKTTYRVRIQVKHCSNKLQQHTCLLSTGAGDNITNSKPTRDYWTHTVTSLPTPKLQNAIKKPLTLLATALSFVRISNIFFQNWFEIFKNLVVNMLLEMLFIEQYNAEMIPEKRKVLTWHSDQTLIIVKLATIEHRPLSSPELCKSNTPHGNVVVRVDINNALGLSPNLSLEKFSAITGSS